MSRRVHAPTESDPLDAIRAELVSAARRKASARRRRRRTLTVGGATLLLLAGTTGAAALTSSTTGVPTVDRLLEKITAANEEMMRTTPPEDGHGSLPSGSERPPMPDIRPESGSASQPLEVPSWREGSKSAVGVAYLSVDGGVCFALAAPGEKVGDEVTGSIGGCAPPKLIARQLADRSAFLTGGTYGARTVVNGYARPDIESIRLLAPGGPVEAQLTDAWAPTGSDGERLRVFVATWKVDVGDDGLQLGEAQRISVDPPLEVTFADGRTERISPR